MNWCVATAVKYGIHSKTRTTNIFISNNIISNKYITYLCAGVTIKDYGEQAFYIRRCDLGR